MPGTPSLESSAKSSATITAPVPSFPIEGKAKIVNQGNDPETLRVFFKDCATAFNGEKFAEIPGKGELNAKISTLLFSLLNAHGLDTCFLTPGASPQELVYRQLAMIPLEVVVRNFAYGSIRKRFQLEEGQAFRQPMIEFFLKNDSLNDPQITEAMIAEMKLLPAGVSLDLLKRRAFQINEIFYDFFEARGIRCADFKLEFGVDTKNRLMLGDELSPDNFRLRDTATGQVLDKDVFRLDLGDLVATYKELLTRLEKTGPEKMEPAAANEPTAKTRTYQAAVFVASRKNILSPESKAILEAVQTMNYEAVETIRAGRCFDITITTSTMIEAEKQIVALGETLLSNPVIEDFRYEIRYAGDCR